MLLLTFDEMVFIHTAKLALKYSKDVGLTLINQNYVMLININISRTENNYAIPINSNV